MPWDPRDGKWIEEAVPERAKVRDRGVTFTLAGGGEEQDADDAGLIGREESRGLRQADRRDRELMAVDDRDGGFPSGSGFVSKDFEGGIDVDHREPWPPTRLP